MISQQASGCLRGAVCIVVAVVLFATGCDSGSSGRGNSTPLFDETTGQIDSDFDGIPNVIEEPTQPPQIPIDQWTNIASGVTVSDHGFVAPATNSEWSAQINSVRMSAYGLTDNYRVSWTFGDSTSISNVMIGLGLLESAAHFSDIDFAFYNSAGRLYIYESGVNVGRFGGVEQGVHLSIEVEKGKIHYVVDGVEVHSSVSAHSDGDYYVDTSFFRGALSVVDLSVAQLGANPDIDGDGVTNAYDLDSDNDTIPDVIEAGLTDVDADLMIDRPEASGSVSSPPDSDGDGIDDYLDLESHNPLNDGSAHDNRGSVFSILDSNGDGQLNATDIRGGLDADGNGVDDLLSDVDQDGIKNDTDTDDDNDGVPDVNDALPFDAKETSDWDGDGVGDNSDTDSDNDGIPDSVEVPAPPPEIPINRWNNAVGGVTSTGSEFTTPSGKSNWTSQINSAPMSAFGVKDNYRVSWSLGSSPKNNNQMIGLGVLESDAHFGDIEFAFYNAAGRLYIYESGVSAGRFGGILPLTMFAIEVDNGRIRYLVNGEVLRTTDTDTGVDYYIDTSFFRGLLNYRNFNVAQLSEDPDVDDDGITNAFDLDSDNDTIADITEAGLADINGDLKVDDRDDQGSVFVPPDSDSDGIADYLDLERLSASNNGDDYDIRNSWFATLDTNDDGRLDRRDANGGVDSDANGVDDLLQDVDQDNIPNAIDDDDDNDGVPDTNDALPFNASETNDTDGDGIGDNSDNDTDNDGIPDIIEEPLPPVLIQIDQWSNLSAGVTSDGNEFTTPAGDSNWTAQINSAPMSVYGFNNNYRVSWTISSSPQSGSHMIGLGSGESGNHFDDIDFAFYQSSRRLYVYESGELVGQFGTVTSGAELSIEVGDGSIRYLVDGTVVNTSEVAGVADYYVDSSFFGGQVSYSNFTVSGLGDDLDIDNDGVTNALDLDSDNDTIADVVEAGLSDTNGNMQVDNIRDQGSVLLPPDSDRDGVPDYLDLESHSAANDGTVFDLESTVFFALDTNTDGQFNNIDASAGKDSDGNGVDDVLQDVDQDGVDNALDGDDDNDGVPDTIDALPFDASESDDTDGDGIGDNSDIDLDNDGIADFVEEPPLPPEIPISNWGNASGNVQVSGNTITTPNGKSNWATQVNSTTMSAYGFTENYKVSWTISSSPLGANHMIGLGVDESSAHFNDIEFAFYLSSGRLFIYESGDFASHVVRQAGTVTEGTRLSIEVDNGSVRYLVDETVVHTTGGVATVDYYIDSSFFRKAVSFSNFSVVRLSTTVDADNDGVTNANDLDSDNDTIADVIEAGFTDSNADLRVDSLRSQGTVVIALDTDDDGIPDYLDLESHNASNDGTDFDVASGNFPALDSNGDGRVDGNDTYGGTDANGDGVDDLLVDIDRDGLENTADPDDDNDGVLDADDALPFNENESRDSDADGVGDNADVFPNDASESSDRDGDGVGDNGDIDTDNDGIADYLEDPGAPQQTPITDWLNSSSGVGVEGSAFTSPVGLSNWSSQINSVRMSTYGYRDNYRVSWTINNSPAGKNQMIGLSAMELSADWSDIEYAFYSSAGNLFIYEAGSITGLFGSVTTGSELAIEVSNGTIRYLLDGRVVYSTQETDRADYYIDSSFFRGAVRYSNFNVVDLNYLPDVDDDGVSNIDDLDSDNDTIPDVIEAGLADTNGDLVVDSSREQGSVTTPPDSDSDGVPDYLDLESYNASNDGSAYDINSGLFSALDSNGNGRLDSGDVDGGVDTNGNGVDDLIEATNGIGL